MRDEIRAGQHNVGLKVTCQLDLENPKARQVYRLLKGKRIESPEAWEAEQRRDGVNARLVAHGVEFNYLSAFRDGGRLLSVEALEAIAAILDGELDRIAGDR